MPSPILRSMLPTGIWSLSAWNYCSMEYWKQIHLIVFIGVFQIICNTPALSAGTSFQEPVYDAINEDTGRPWFGETDNNITVGPGERAILKCRVENLGTKTVTWSRKDQDRPMTIGLFTFAPDTRITVDYNQRENEWSLFIQSVKPEDEGIYQCKISTKQDAENVYNVKLNVLTVQVTGESYVVRGDTVTLTCNATGRPDPPHDVEWYKDDRKIDGLKNRRVLITNRIETKVLISRLTIQDSTMEDVGQYMCVASNQDRAKIKVMILNVPTQGAVGKQSKTNMFRSSATSIMRDYTQHRTWTLWICMICHQLFTLLTLHPASRSQHHS